MKKVGRNDPCPCNSGKKYKKCHGAANKIELSAEPYNYELRKLQKGLADFALQTYGEKLDEGLRVYKWPSPEIAQEKKDAFILGMTAWYMIHKQLENEETVATLYVQQERGKIKQARVKDTFTEWTNVVPSLYVIEQIDEKNLHLRDVRTNTVHQMTKTTKSTAEEGNYLFGTLLPFVKRNEPLLTMLEVSKEEEQFIQKIKTIDEADLIVQYPTLLLEQIEPSDSEQKEFPVYEWEKEIYESVMHKFTENMKTKEADDTLIETGIAIWQKFANTEQPNFQKPAGFAAAMEYIVYGFLAETARPSQKELADRYGVSTNTVKRNVEKFYEAYQKNETEYKFIEESNKAQEPVTLT